MIRTIQAFFSTRIIIEPSQPPSERTLQLATAALLIEVSRADHDVGQEEKLAIVEAVQRSFGLSAEETEEIVQLAEEEVNESISLYEFTRLVDENFSLEQKKHIVGLLWTIAFSDDRLEEREEYLIRKIAKLLHVRARRFHRREDPRQSAALIVSWGSRTRR